ncbi:methyl-accepting chemotaxis protein [Paenibacillus sp. JCM 10914]|uniref:methyl-accepting chemotaxis protein n=1 Tax=Paenibacillus sp. JCM 10914 TaxID=1236974 RepID=UPI0003CC9CAC|nr:methyl-accepting chemotaxis protein [Paenibacillus sp. JCM 10914]GAE05892.1 methyl-accepting chemotaxis protein [Paenibacillus sp. JCM 10914]
MIIEVSEQIVRLLQMALDRPDPHFYDAVVVTAGGALSGVLTVRDLLGLSRSLQMNADGKRELILFESDRLTSNIESSLNEVRTAAARTQEECKKMKESAQLGKGQLKLVESSYQSVVTDLRKHQDQATTLLEHTNRISSISGMITELANRSNLLAMNASIEAAHAGEHGRGFQVVAGEVQSLAQQTRALSADIAQLLEYIQQLGQDTTASSAASLHEIQLSERHVREGSHMFYEMENAVHEVELSGDQVLQLAEHTVHRVQLIKYELAGMR